MSQPSAPSDRAATAAAWRERLRAGALTPETLHEFWTWRQDPLNLEAFQALERPAPRILRFFVRPDREAFSVVDIWTGQPAVIAMTPQTGLSELDAEHTARLLNRRAAGGDRDVLQ